jgi:hypothetical protein
VKMEYSSYSAAGLEQRVRSAWEFKLASKFDRRHREIRFVCSKIHSAGTVS